MKMGTLGKFETLIMMLNSHKLKSIPKCFCETGVLDPSPPFRISSIPSLLMLKMSDILHKVNDRSAGP